MTDPMSLSTRGTIPCRPLVLALLAAACVSCAYLPKAGPLRSELASQAQTGADANQRPFALVRLSQPLLEAMQAAPTPGFAQTFGDSAPAEPLLGVGDAVSVVIFEAGSEPLFATAAAGSGLTGARGAVLPEQTVALDGSIGIPFAGRVQARGRSTEALAQAIEQALKGRAAQPQVLVTLTRSVGNAVTVLGEVGAGARVPLSAHGERLLDVLAASGGLRGNVHETWVQLEREQRSLRLPLARLLHDPAENLRLRADDTVLITRQPATFTVFGATGRSAQIDFGAEHLSLTEAVGKAGGLLDARADPRGVYLFRYETPEAAAALGISGLVRNGTAPVVYEFDFLQASTMFLSQKFSLRDRDVLYVASAPANELEKFLQLLGLVTQPALSGIAVGNALK